jgi:hypothetical protein
MSARSAAASYQRAAQASNTARRLSATLCSVLSNAQRYSPSGPIPGSLSAGHGGVADIEPRDVRLDP